MMFALILLLLVLVHWPSVVQSMAVVPHNAKPLLRMTSVVDQNTRMDRRQSILSPLTTAAAAVATATLQIPTAQATNLPSIQRLSDGSAFPLASFGLQVYDDATAYRWTQTALQVGYRNFFASVLAGNQKGFAQAVRDSKIPREELYICGSVVSNRAQGYKAAYRATQRGIQGNLAAFAAGGITYLDQIMLDYPGPDADSIRGQWAAFQDMHQQGLTKSLSVSNFSPAQLDVILNDPNTKVKPVVNQLPFSVAYHPNLEETLAEHAKRGVLVQAWAPLGKSLGGRFNSSIKGECAQIGKAYNKSWAQVALRWIVQHGASFATQSQNRDHFAQDLDIFDFELTSDEMQRLDQLA